VQSPQQYSTEHDPTSPLHSRGVPHSGRLGRHIPPRLRRRHLPWSKSCRGSQGDAGAAEEGRFVFSVSSKDRQTHSTGKRVIFVTNNASKSRRMYKSTFDKLGIEVKAVSLPFGRNILADPQAKQSRKKFSARHTLLRCTCPVCSTSQRTRRSMSSGRPDSRKS